MGSSSKPATAVAQGETSIAEPVVRRSGAELRTISEGTINPRSDCLQKTGGPPSCPSALSKQGILKRTLPCRRRDLIVRDDGRLAIDRSQKGMQRCHDLRALADRRRNPLDR